MIIEPLPYDITAEAVYTSLDQIKKVTQFVLVVMKMLLCSTCSLHEGVNS